ncbi:MAG: putative glycoside hydrolase family 15 protein [Gemmatimonadetes bacterium]|nr:putative glycoside hydrolase family 15 protein [Gemmatimonadota bacterium]
MTRHLILLLVLLAPASCGAESPLGPGDEAEVNGLVNDFIWVGVYGEARQFTDSELQTIADDYDFVVIAAFHCGGVRSCHAEAARRLKALDPDITVLAYMNGFIREFPGVNELELYGQETWDDGWWLRHQSTGEVIEVAGGRGGFKDLTDPELRRWMIGIVEGWLEEGPFDGVAFDRLQGIPLDASVWLERVGSAKGAAVNGAIVDLLRETKAALGEERLVVYNGLKDAQSTFTGRLFTDGVDAVDGVANEYFCYHKDRGFEMPPGLTLEETVIRDVEAHAWAAGTGTAVLAHVSYQTNDLSHAEKDHINRLCYGSFLLGHRPGYTSYKFGFLTGVRLLTESAAEQALDFGDPLGAMQARGGGLYTRELADGGVAVNLGGAAADYAASFDGVIMNGGVVGASVAQGQVVRVPATDALFLMRR